MRSGLQAHHAAGWGLLIAVALYGLYSYGAAEWGGSHFLQLHRQHPHLLPLHRVASNTALGSASSGLGAPGSGGSSSGPQRAAATAHPLSVCAAFEDPMAEAAATPSSGGLKESYSIWARPTGRVGEQLVGEIAHLAARHGAPAFPAHVTVLGDIERPREEVVGLMRELAKQVKKYRVNFVDVTRGTFFYQCVFLLAAKDEGTMAAAAAARSVFGMTTKPYMPHLSLLYADLEDSEKTRVVEYETARLYGESSGYDTLLVENGFEVGSFALWYTPTEDRTLQSWCLVEEFELSG